MGKTSWDTLKAFGGSAKPIPSLVKRLADKSSTKVTDALENLGAHLIKEGKWCTASAPALALVLDTLPAVKTDLGWVIDFAADVASGGCEHAFARTKDNVPKDVVAVVEERLDAIAKLATSKNAWARAGYASLAAAVPALSTQTLPRVLALARDKQPVVRASAALALAVIGAGDLKAIAVVRKLIGDKDAVVRGAATLAELRLDDDASFGSRAAGLGDWLGQPRGSKDNKPRLLWFIGERTRPLRDIAARRGNAGDFLDTLIEAAPSLSPAMKSVVCELIVEAGGFEEFKGLGSYVALPDELSAEQRAIAMKLAGADLFPESGFGLAACGKPRRRWLGIDPPGPSDRVVTIKLKGKTYRGPFWRVCDTYERKSITAGRDFERVGDRFGPPEEIRALLDGVDRWHAMIAHANATYGGFGVDQELVDEEVSRVKLDDAAIARADEIANELLNERRVGLGMPPILGTGYGYTGVGSEVVALLLLPFARAKTPWPEAWDALIGPGVRDALLAEIAGAMTEARRHAYMERCLQDQIANPHPILDLDKAFTVFELAPTQTILDRAIELQAQHAKAMDASQKSYLKEFIREMTELLG